MTSSKFSPRSKLVKLGRPHAPGQPLNTPLSPASNYVIGGRTTYARDGGTDTWLALEETLGALEDARALTFASGMAAVQAVFDLMPAGANILMPADCYQGVTAAARRGEAKYGWQLQSLETDNTEGWTKAIPNADLIWLESPSNPLLKVADLDALCALPRKDGAICVVDNTFCTPLLQQPLDLGADIAMQSMTKFIGGHSDLLGGVLTTRNDDLFARLQVARQVTGATPGALEAFLALRGLRTLHVRLERSCENALLLQDWLARHPAIETVRFPGFGSMISFDVKGGAEAADRVCQKFELITHTTSLGSVESTCERRAAIPGQEHIPPGLLRLSVGIEDIEDLMADLDQALKA